MTHDSGQCCQATRNYLEAPWTKPDVILSTCGGKEIIKNASRTPGKTICTLTPLDPKLPGGESVHKCLRAHPGKGIVCKQRLLSMKVLRSYRTNQATTSAYPWLRLAVLVCTLQTLRELRDWQLLQAVDFMTAALQVSETIQLNMQCTMPTFLHLRLL